MKLRKKRQRPFTLLEVMITLGLLAGLLTFLFGFYREINQMHVEFDKTRQQHFRLLYAQERIASVLSSALFKKDEMLIGKITNSLFYTVPQDNLQVQGPSLVLMYNNGVAHPPCFSQDVLGRFYLDKDGRFCLATWPSPVLWQEDGKSFDKIPLKKEILVENIKEAAFYFYVPPKLEMIEPSPVDVGKDKLNPEPGRWHSDWDLAYQELPAMAKVVLKRKPQVGMVDSDIIFIIPLAGYDKPVFYSR